MISKGLKNSVNSESEHILLKCDYMFTYNIRQVLIHRCLNIISVNFVIFHVLGKKREKEKYIFVRADEI